MDEKSLTSLEFDAIRTALAEQASFTLSRDLALSLVPAATYDDVVVLQQETREASDLLREHPGTSARGARDVREAVHRAGMGGVLEPLELRTVAETIDVAQRLRSLLLPRAASERVFERLGTYARRISDLSAVSLAVTAAIHERGEVLDSASSALARARADVRDWHGRLMEQLRAILGSRSYAQAIQEPIITTREGRYVVPVKAEFRSRLPGIVHDTSASGQTLFVEPLGTVETGNRWREARKREEEEYERVLQRLSELVGRETESIVETVDALGQIDLVLTKARYAERLRGVAPEISNLENADGNEVLLRLHEARHPLLGEHAVSMSLEMARSTRIVVISGPNTGGKTVAMKTVGLLTAMAASGLHVPAEPGTVLPAVDNIFADIGDQQSIERSLSTFSSHILNVIHTLHHATRRSLVLFDELGVGTDPEEGAALAVAILDELLRIGCPAVVTTHYSQLKAYAASCAGVQNASVEFDEESLAPTYRFVQGLPGGSFGVVIAQRLGMPTSVVERARSLLSAEEVELGRLLEQVREQREEAARMRSEIERQRAEAAAEVERLRADRARVAAEAEQVREQARRAGLEELEAVRSEIESLRRRARSAASRQETQEVAAQARRSVQSLRRKLARTRPTPEELERPVAAGDYVSVPELGASGRVLSIEDDTAEVLVGRMKLRTPVGSLRVQQAGGRDPQRVSEPLSYRLQARTAPPPMELDIRGKRAEEVERMLGEYIDAAYISGLPMLRIIHGKGTGVLRQIVRETLSRHPLVESLEVERDARGGEGVTTAVLARR